MHASVFFDTNVLVYAAVRKNTCAKRALERAESAGCFCVEDVSAPDRLRGPLVRTLHIGSAEPVLA